MTMQMVLSENGARLQQVAPMPIRMGTQAYVKDYQQVQPKLTVGKINLIRYDVKHAEQWGPATFFRKAL